MPINAIRRMNHLRPPMIKESTLRYSYKTTNIETLKDLLTEQKRVPLQMTCSFMNRQPVDSEEDIDPALDPLAAIVAAKQRARQPYARRITSRSSVVVADVQGRSKREFELQWWPRLYSGKYGKLTLRFYVSKVSMVC